MSIIKTITVDDFYDMDEARRLFHVANFLPFVTKEYGEEINDFNMVPENADQLFSRALNINMHVIEKDSGVFRKPVHFIHFESFEKLNEWIFVVALDHTTFDLYEHESGVKNALEGYKFNYRNLFEWNHRVNYQLAPSQGILFRPWLFHSFTSGMIQSFKLEEVENDL